MTPEKESDRYLRLQSTPGMSENALELLRSARVAFLGFGGPAGACATYLAESGIGNMTLIDGLRVEEPDLAEQFVFTETDIGEFRVAAASKYLRARNPNLKIQLVKEPFTAHSAERLLASADIVVDALEDWQTKILASDVCLQIGRTLVHCWIQEFEFQMYTIIPGRSACLRCVLAKMGLEDLAVSGTSAPRAFAPLAGMAGSFQAIEVIKLLTGLGPTPGNHLIKFDCLRRDFDDITDLGPRPDCPDCGRPF